MAMATIACTMLASLRFCATTEEAGMDVTVESPDAPGVVPPDPEPPAVEVHTTFPSAPTLQLHAGPLNPVWQSHVFSHVHLPFPLQMFPSASTGQVWTLQFSPPHPGVQVHAPVSVLHVPFAGPEQGTSACSPSSHPLGHPFTSPDSVPQSTPV